MPSVVLIVGIVFLGTLVLASLVLVACMLSSRISQWLEENPL